MNIYQKQLGSFAPVNALSSFTGRPQRNTELESSASPRRIRPENLLVDCDPQLAEGSASPAFVFLVRRVPIPGWSTMILARAPLGAISPVVSLIAGASYPETGPP